MTSQIQRRNFLKYAAAGTAAVAAGAAMSGPASAQMNQDVDPKVGRFQDNGVPAELRIRNDRLSDEAIRTLAALPCAYRPIAIKFLAVPPKVFGFDYPHTTEKKSLCQFVSIAQKTNKAFYMTVDNENCMGKMVLGMWDEPPIGASGQAGFDFGCYRSHAANSRVYYNIPRLLKGTCNYVIFSPIEQCKFNPDLVIFVGDADMTDIVLRATSYISGDMWESISTNVISCAWTYVHPWITGKVNHFETGCHHGMGRRKVYPKGLSIIAVPYQKLDELVLALRQMDWKLISFRPNEKDQTILRNRMRNWNNLAKMIDKNSSFALPENKKNM
ncbi:MAG: DUF169 domain-containing protein [Sutterellaceae bacterium]|nr:DUF169 domain-containing protein [Sutterellaceae bacterium]